MLGAAAIFDLCLRALLFPDLQVQSAVAAAPKVLDAAEAPQVMVAAVAPQPVAAATPQPVAAAAPQLVNAAVVLQSVALAAPRKREAYQKKEKEPSRLSAGTSSVAPAKKVILPKQQVATMLPSSAGAPASVSQLLLRAATIPYQQRETSQQVRAATCKMSMH